MLILLALKADGQIFVGRIEAIIHQIAHNIAINRANKITRLYPYTVGRAFRYYLTHPSIHFWHKLFLRKKRPGADLKIVPRGNVIQMIITVMWGYVKFFGQGSGSMDREILRCAQDDRQDHGKSSLQTRGLLP